MRTPFAIITSAAFIITNLIGPMPRAVADDFHLPVPGVMVPLSQPLQPPVLRGIKVHPENPFRFDFILDRGDDPLSDDAVKSQSSKLIKYFLASLTIPEKDLWVNLSPYEKDRIIPQSFGLTEMGRDLLAEDYLLKQITASLIYPEDKVGKKFWKRVYREAAKRYGTTDIPVNTFNKVWIVPEKAVVYENAKAGAAYVVESKLKVMLEQDYLSMTKHTAGDTRVQGSSIDRLGSQIIREIVIPELTKEVNDDKNFAHLRQVYNSLILATWYKNKVRDSILGLIYADKKKVAGVGYNDLSTRSIYQRYLQAFKKGVYNYIKEDIDPLTQEMIPRKYFSGGMSLLLTEKIDYAQASQVPDSLDKARIVTVDLAASPMDRAMAVPDDPISRLIRELENGFARKNIKIDKAIDPRKQRSLINHRIFTPLINAIASNLPMVPIESGLLKEFIDVMDRNENPLVENQRSDYTYNLLLLAVKNKNRRVWDDWLQRANEGMGKVAEENQRENEKFAVTSDTLRPALPKTIVLEKGYVLKLKKDTRWGELDRNAYIVCDIIDESSGKLAGRMGLGFDVNTSSWLAVDPHGIKINDEYRRGGQYLGRKALLKLVETLGVIRSAGLTPDVTSPDAQHMWEKAGAKVEYVGFYYAPYLFANELGWSWVIRNDKAQLSSRMDRRGFLKMAGILTLPLVLPGVARSAVGPVPNIFTARKILMDHLNKLANTGQISKAAVYSTDYWLNDVFNSDRTMYLYALDDIETAVEAGIKTNDKGENFDAKRFSTLAQQALNGQKPDAKLKRFFTGSWSRYMSSLYNNDNYALLEKDIIRQRARALDPALGDMIDKLVINASKWDRNDIDTQWQKFNDAYLIPRKYYASVSPQYNGRNWYYFALIYRIESDTQVTLPSGKTIDVLTGRRVDNDDFFSGDLGNAPEGFSHVFIDLNAIDGSAKLYLRMTLRKILPKTSISLEKLTGFVDLLKKIKGLAFVDLKASLLDSTKKHEEAHKVYEGLKDMKLDKGFGMFQKSFDDLRKGNPEGVDVAQSEVYAYLSQIRDSRLPGIVILNLFEFFMRGTSTTQFYAACFILNQMTQNDLDYNDPDGVIDPVNKLLQMPDNVLSEKAGEILKGYFPPIKDQAMANDQKTGGIDLTPAVMDLRTQNAGETIKFRLDPAILRQFQIAPGFVPVIINIQPMNDLHRFLGINDAAPR